MRHYDILVSWLSPLDVKENTNEIEPYISVKEYATTTYIFIWLNTYFLKDNI